MSLIEPGSSTEVDVWRGVVGQQAVVDRLRHAAEAPVHAYLFLGAPGTGTFDAALAFAAVVLAEHDAAPERERAARLALAGTHPDLVVVEPEGSAFRVEETAEIIRVAQTSPVEGRRKVIIVVGIDAIQEAAIGKLLKVLEEPPASTLFVLLAEHVAPEIVTIASRCVVVEFSPIPSALLEAALVGEGVPPGRAKEAAAASGGDLGRARLLAVDDALNARAELWRSVPDRLDGRGAVVWELAHQLREAMDRSETPLKERQAAEVEALEAEVEARGERGSGRAVLVARHKRELRRQRTDEIRFGLGLLSRLYRDRLLQSADPTAEAALAAIQAAAAQLNRNPNEALLFQALLLRLRLPA